MGEDFIFSKNRMTLQIQREKSEVHPEFGKTKSRKIKHWVLTWWFAFDASLHANHVAFRSSLCAESLPSQMILQINIGSKHPFTVFTSEAGLGSMNDPLVIRGASLRVELIRAESTSEFLLALVNWVRLVDLQDEFAIGNEATFTNPTGKTSSRCLLLACWGLLSLVLFDYGLILFAA